MTPRKLAPYVLQTLARLQVRGRVACLQDLVDAIPVRRGDLRRTVNALHSQGYVDALRMRLTLPGFVIGARLLSVELPPVRAMAPAAVAAA